MSKNQRQYGSKALSEILDLLEVGSFELVGRFTNSSNGTYLVQVEGTESGVQAVYKPGSGERPLWDFPSGLFQREVAAYELDRILQLNMVPPTLLRTDGPLGPGSLQLYIDARFELHYFDFIDDPSHHEAMIQLACFDIVANNSDRKGGHILIDGNDDLWAIDNGLCFHEEDKLRTVIWEFAGNAVPDRLLPALAGLTSSVPEPLARLLSAKETKALRQRARRLLQWAELPEIDPDMRPYPWPII